MANARRVLAAGLVGTGVCAVAVGAVPALADEPATLNMESGAGVTAGAKPKPTPTPTPSPTPSPTPKPSPTPTPSPSPSATPAPMRAQSPGTAQAVGELDGAAPARPGGRARRRAGLPGNLAAGHGVLERSEPRERRRAQRQRVHQGGAGVGGGALPAGAYAGLQIGAAVPVETALAEVRM